MRMFDVLTVFIGRRMKVTLFIVGVVAFATAGAILVQKNPGWLSNLGTGGEPTPDLSRISPATTMLPELLTRPVPDGDARESSASTMPPYRGEPVEALNGDPRVVQSLPPAVWRDTQEKLRVLSESLEKNPGETQLWMEVAYLKHFFNDDVGARDAYEYLNLVADGAALPFYNLALLYAYNLNEPVKAQEKFESALHRDPWNVSYYIGFSDFWREVKKDLPQAEKTLLRGLEKVPSSLNLAIAIASLYRTMGNTVGAIEYYEKALVRPELGPAERESITAEVGRLKSELVR